MKRRKKMTVEIVVLIVLLIAVVYYFASRKAASTTRNANTKAPAPKPPATTTPETTTPTTPPNNDDGNDTPVILLADRPPAGTALTPYLWPAEGVTQLATSGEVDAKPLDLYTTTDADGRVILRDRAATFNFLPWDDGGFTNAVKRYYIGMGLENYYTPQQLTDGLDITPYAGSEIIVQAAYYQTGEPKIVTYKQQLVYVPSIADSFDTDAGKYFFNYPGRPFQSRKHLRFNEYVTAATLNKPDSHFVGMWTTNLTERNNPATFANIGVGSPISTQKKIIHFGDNWLYDLGHPLSYSGGDWAGWFQNFLNQNGGEAGAKARIKQQFRDTAIAQAANASLLFINNEIEYYWNPLFSAWIKECYDEFRAARPNCILSAYGGTILEYANFYNLDKNLAYADYQAAGPYQNYAGQHIKLKPQYLAPWGLQTATLTSYFRNPAEYRNIYEIALETAFFEKWQTGKKLLTETWHTAETTTQETRLGQLTTRHNNRTVITFRKATVSPHLMRNKAAAAAFFGQVLLEWDDGYSVDENAPAYYPYTDSYYKDTGERTPSGPVVDTPFVTSNLDSLFDGLYSVYANRDLLAGPLQFADFVDGAETREGVNAFAAAAMTDKRAFVAYRRVNNNYLLFAYDAFNNGIKTLSVKLKDANGAIITKPVKLFADRASIVKI